MRNYYVQSKVAESLAGQQATMMDRILLWAWEQGIIEYVDNRIYDEVHVTLKKDAPEHLVEELKRRMKAVAEGKE